MEIPDPQIVAKRMAAWGDCAFPLFTSLVFLGLHQRFEALGNTHAEAGRNSCYPSASCRYQYINAVFPDMRFFQLNYAAMHLGRALGPGFPAGGSLVGIPAWPIKCQQWCV